MKTVILWPLILLPVAQALADTLPEIQTIANRIPQTENTTLASVTIITENDIARSPADSLPELLQSLPGISMSRSGGPGQPAALFFRGAESDHTLVLVNGIRLSSVSDGGTALHFFPLSQISRIEILRGSRSGLYGSEAIGGVISITTKQPQKNRLTAQLKGGSFNSIDSNLGVGWQQQATSLSLQLSGERTDGINANQTGNPDKDSYENAAISGQLSHLINDEMKLNLSLLHSEGRNEFDNPFSSTSEDKSDFVQQAINLQFIAMPSDHLEFELSLGQSRDELDIENDFPGFFNSRIDQFTTQTNYSYGKQTVSTGIDYRYEKLNSSTDFKQNQRDNTGVFIGWSGHRQRHHLNLSLRRDHNESFGNHNSGHFEYGFDITDSVRLSSSYATGFKSPSFNDLYFPASDFYQPNPDLLPEKSESFELGIRATYRQSVVKLNAYTTEIDDMISFTADPVTFIATVDNLNSTKIDGVEINMETSFLGNQLNTAFTHINARDRKTDENLTRRPANTASLSLSREFNQFSLLLQYLYSSSREDLDFNAFPASRVKLDGYSLLNASLQYQPSRNWILFLQLNNLLNENYQTVNGYHQPGFSAFLGVRFKPES